MAYRQSRAYCRENNSAPVIYSFSSQQYIHPHFTYMTCQLTQSTRSQSFNFAAAETTNEPSLLFSRSCTFLVVHAHILGHQDNKRPSTGLKGRVKMKTASTLLLTAALVGGASCRRVLQDIPEVGLGHTRSPTPSTSLAGESSTTGAEEELVEALEADDQVTGKIKKHVEGIAYVRRAAPAHFNFGVHRFLSQAAGIISGYNYRRSQRGRSLFLLHLDCHCCYYMLAVPVVLSYGSTDALADFLQE